AKSSAKDWLSAYEAKERENTGIKQLKVGYNKVFGYYIEVSNSNLSAVPLRFQRKQTLTTGERFITEELKEMEEIILGADEKALQIEQEIFDNIKAQLKTVLSALQINSYAAAECDLIQSLATVALQNGYTRPKTDLSGEIVIKNGRHPVIESIKKRSEYIPNDVIMDKDSRILVITGPNMAGKSTYMRQAALIVLMAHMGSFVPAEKAKIGLVDRIFTRVGAGDNLASGQSTFMVEMTEMANILNNATYKSLIILDEVGRGTSTIDGLSIAWAIVEHLSLKLKAKTLFATHYHELAELESTLPSLKNYHVLVKESDGTVTFLYKISRGSANKSFGIEVAELAGVKKEITKRAAQVMQAIEDSQGAGLIKRVSDRPSATAVPGEEQIGLFAEDSRMGKIEAVLKDVDVNSITPVQSLTILSELVSIVKPKRKKASK
ncbi:MAG TPA: DNA mismatch repair protein MutS, partial [Candidatus Stercoripulliclostridium merdigallinarum]|nr:DNA mismatch repair protein MutS [Candidatus Stercoripulliclostridium merdigallinarum]